jgi:hypothetical protein
MPGKAGRRRWFRAASAFRDTLLTAQIDVFAKAV